MNEDLAPVLKEIAGLLRQHLENEQRKLEMQQEARRVQQQMMAQAFGPLTGLPKPDSSEGPEEKTDTPNFPRLREMANQQMGKFQEQADQERQERREFQARLLAEMERQNNVLEQILARLVPGTPI